MANGKTPTKIVTIEDLDNVKANLRHLEDLIEKFEKGVTNLLGDYGQGNVVLLHSTVSSSVDTLRRYVRATKAEVESKYPLSSPLPPA
jgi:hypothetical protein